MSLEQLAKRVYDTADGLQKLTTTVGDILSEQDRMKGAFPMNSRGEPDYYGHCGYHEAKIEAAKAERRFWDDLRLDLAKKGAWALLTTIAGLVVWALGRKLAWHFGLGAR